MKEYLNKELGKKIQDEKKKMTTDDYKKLSKINLHTPEISEYSAKLAKINFVRKILKKYIGPLNIKDVNEIRKIVKK